MNLSEGIDPSGLRPVSKSLAIYELRDDEVARLADISQELIAQYDSVESVAFANDCMLAAQELPRSLRSLAHRYRQLELPCSVLLLRGMPVDDTRIGPSPLHWDAPWRNPRSLNEEVMQCLMTSLLGDMFGWRTQENGRFLRHIVPIRKDHAEQLGGGSSVTLVWHNEEAFHEHRADFLSILCYRNDERAETIFCGIEEIGIPDDMWRVLSAQRFMILPDKSHLPEQNVSEHWRLDDHVFAHIRRMHENPEPVSALSGLRAKPWLRVDEAFMAALPGDEEAECALRWLIDACYTHRTSVVMHPGDMVWVDNKRAVHGRTIYSPNYGPRQRWLRRVNVHVNLRETLPFRQAPSMREIL
ncbi:TauD/TfdA family dioxygenase [Burkholderia theae]|uniref:TauD/TfdA family dioxygenase n=1 Tax=Burkholderia theae TaxID=3143496 RepID=UPI003AFAA215